MGEGELPKRNLRFHYGGNFKEIGKVPSMLHKYSGGETVDSCDWDGEQVCLLDLVKEVEKLISVPECCKVKLWWLWLSRKDGYVNQKILVDKDTGVMFLWKNAKPDKENFIHLYLELENKVQSASTCVDTHTSVPPQFASVISNTKSQLDEVLQFSQVETRSDGGDRFEAGEGIKQGVVIDLSEELNDEQELGVQNLNCLQQDTYFNPFDDPEVNSWYADDEVDRNQGKVDSNRTQDDSNDDEDYVVSDYECDIGVLNQKYEVSTRSKGPPLIDVNRIDATEDYESPHSATDSETDDDVHCDDDLTQEEIQKSKDRLAADAREYARKRAAERRKLTAIREKELCVEQQKKQQQEIDDDITWINRTSRIEDDEYAVEDNTDEEGLPTLKVDQRWYNIYKCRSYLKTFAIKRHFVLELERNDSNRIVAVCRGKSDKGTQCTWRCSIGRMNDYHTMRVGVLHNEHDCVSYEAERNPTATAPWIAEQIVTQMRLHHRTFKPRNIMADMWNEFLLDIKYWQAWHSLTLALELVHGNYEESYKKVPELCRQILNANPGSIARCSRNAQFGMFESMILCFKASIDGFHKGCRPLIGLDGCFLKGKYGGTCLSIVALDGNNGMLPLAIFVCVRENHESWSTFLKIMQPYLARHDQEPLTIMSDRQKGLDAAVASIFPGCYQRYCFRHMTANMKKNYKGVDDLAWLASKAYAKSWFEYNMNEMAKLDAKAANYLTSEKLSAWSRCNFYEGSKSEHTTNNWSESFNSRILESRDKPIVGLITTVMNLLMKLQFERRNLCKTWNQDGLVPRVLEIIETKKAKIGGFRVYGSDDHNYQVKNFTQMWWNVDLAGKNCTCGEWQLTGIPCDHAVRVLNPMRPDWKSYCSPFFTVAAYKDVYKGSIKPILHETDWCKTMEEIQPPIRPRAPGRPPMNRKRGLDEGPIQYSGKRQHRCAICKEYGHNKTTCMGGGAECDAMQAAIAASLAAASQPPPPKGATPAGGRPRTRARKIVIGQPLESAFEDEDLLSNGRGKGKGKGKAKTNAAGRGKGPKGRGRDNTTNGHPEYSYSTMSEDFSQPMMPSPTFQFRPPMMSPCTSSHTNLSFNANPSFHTNQQFHSFPTNPSFPSYKSANPFNAGTINHQGVYMRPPPPPTRQVVRPSVFSYQGVSSGIPNNRLATMLGVTLPTSSTQASTTNPSQMSSQASTTNPSQKTTKTVTRWMI